MANKNYELRFNFNTKDVEIASQGVLSLKNQILILKKELGRSDLDQQQFEILSKKLNDTKDRFQATEARSRELFGTLSLLPGPVGDISRSLDGAVSLLKTFSQFKLADIKAQFGGLGNDLKDIFSTIGSVGEATDQAVGSNEDLTKSTNDLTDASTANVGANVQQVSAIQDLADAQTKAINPIQEQINKLDGVIDAQQKQLTASKNLEAATYDSLESKIASNNITQEELDLLNKSSEQVRKNQNALNESVKQRQVLVDELQASTTATETNTQVNQQNAGAQKGAALGARLNAAANQAVAASATAASTALRVLKGVLISLGIGAAIVLIGELISQFYSWATGSAAAEAAQKKLNDELERTNELVELDNATFQRANAERIAALKASGATEKQIRQQQLKDRYNDYSRAFDNEQEAIRQYNAALGKADEETLKKLGDNLTKRTEDTRNALSSYRVLVSESRAAENKEAQNNSEKNKETSKKNAAEELARKKAELDAKIQLEIDKGNTDNRVLEKLLEDRLQLELRSGKKSQAELDLIRSQNKKKVEDAVADDKKVLDEQVKNTEDFNRRVRDLKTNAILDDVEREKEARTNKYNDDLQALEIDKEFIKKSETEKAQIRADVKTAYNNEINKIDEKQQQKERDAVLKAYDDRLRLLELQSQGLLQGTKAYFDNRAAILAETEAKEMQMLKNDLETKKITQAQYEAEVFAVKQKYAELGKQLENQKLEAVGRTISATIDAVAGLTNALASSYDEEAKTSEAAFNKRKKLQIATAVMSAASGIVQILTQPSTLPSPFDWIVKGINAAALAIATGVNISKIRKTQFEAPDSGEDTKSPAPYKVTANRASGGIVSGPGTSTSDSIPARLSNGEFVVNARATSAYLPLLSAINDAGLQPRFAMGGLATQAGSTETAQVISTAIAAGLTERPVKTYVVGQDMSSQQQFDRTLKSRSLL